MKINRKIHIFIKRKLPSSLRQAKHVFFISFSTSTLIGLLAITAWLDWLGNTRGAHATFIASIMVAVSICIWRYSNVIWGSVLYQLTLLGVVIYNAAFTGGVTSPALGWLAIIPLFPLFTASRQWALGSISISLFSVLALYFAQSHGMLPVIDDVQQFSLQSVGEDPAHLQTTWQSMAFAAGMFALMLFAQMILLQTYDTTNEEHLHKLRQSNKRLEALSTNLKLANTHKDQFLAMVSHEMRTPLNAVMGYLGLLSADTRLPPPAEQYVEGARNSASHLVTVINDLLDFSQIQQGKLVLNPQTVNLREMLTRTHKTLSLRANDQGLLYPLTIEPSVPHWASIDPHRLTQIIINLLGNALKFTSKGHVAMYASFTSHDGCGTRGELRIDVEDTGTGIANESLEAIFKPFVQLTTNDNNLKTGNALHGNGLGLAITRSLVQSHKGVISVISQLGQGSTFTVKLPIEKAAAPATLKVSELTTSDQALDLLVVDDHLTNRVVVTATIKRSLPNALIDHAENGTEALKKMQAHLYDLVIMDLVMPDLTGTEVVRQIRNNTQAPFKNVCVVALTANVAEEAVNECMSLGFKEVLPKPYDKEVLIQTILTHALKTGSQPTAL